MRKVDYKSIPILSFHRSLRMNWNVFIDTTVHVNCNIGNLIMDTLALLPMFSQVLCYCSVRVWHHCQSIVVGIERHSGKLRLLWSSSSFTLVLKLLKLRIFLISSLSWFQSLTLWWTKNFSYFLVLGSEFIRYKLLLDLRSLCVVGLRFWGL